jgi:tRNA-splicing ligase RtcB
MSYTLVRGDRIDIRFWTDPADVEPDTMRQLRNIAALPWVQGLAVMPDVHLGKGSAVGAVIAMRDAVAPAAVGVDIGCGMTAQRTSLTANDLPENLGRLRSEIEKTVPVGFASHQRPVDPTTMQTGAVGWGEFWSHFDDLAHIAHRLRGRAEAQLGTLGGGNHFLEVCLDADDRVWLMLHSGSRNIGNELARYHIERARALPHNKDLPDRDLAVFLAGTPGMHQYRRDLFWAQEYARRNRAVMMALLRSVLRRHFHCVAFDDEISCHHNYMAEECHEGLDLLITRKGAIRAGEGELGIIPGSMGTRSYIVRGLGNPDAYLSASHGAGRRMSRHQARRQFSVADLVAQTKAVECRKDAGVLDEIPAAYKDIDRVMAQQSDLVDVVACLHQVICVKG